MTTNLIPMAGNGQRFKEAGYKVSKPLIVVSGEPMVLKAIKTFPNADNWVFVCKEEHINKDHIDKKIRKKFPNSIFVPVSNTTEGQACTCLLAKESIDPENSLFIGNCDISMTWDKNRYKKLLNEADTDIICFAFTRRSGLALMPKAFGWVKVREDGKYIDEVSVKVPITNDPYNDYAIVGCFYFKKAKYFFEIAGNLIRNNIRVNNEFYVDSCINQAIKMGYKPKMFVVEQYVGWGTPQDLSEYNFWEKYFST